MESSDGMDEDELEDLYNWVDEIPLSRPKKSIARDFADGGWFFRFFTSFYRIIGSQSKTQ